MFLWRVFFFAFCRSSAIDFAEVRKQASEIKDDIVSWRRKLHERAELMYQEHNTSKFIQEALREMGVSFTTGWCKNTQQHRIPGSGGTGVVAEIGTGQPPIIALRADMDALPIFEQTSVPFRSKTDGIMHACGHDGHASMLLGAAKLLQRNQKAIAGTVRLIFQPAEEGGAGAKRMQEEGVLRDVSRVFGMHLMPSLPSGSIGGREGISMAGGDQFEFRIVGKGAHGAMPHQGIDPVSASAAVIQSLQTIVSRETDPLDSAVISITKIKSGDAFNVIPAEASLGGTIRSLSEAGLVRLRERIVEVATSVAAGHGCRVEGVQFSPDYYPPTHNDEALWSWIASPGAGIADSIVAPPMDWKLKAIMGSEDFAFFARVVPGAFIFLGQGSDLGNAVPGFPTNTALHNPQFNMDESVLDLGSALHTHLAIRSLTALGAMKAEM